MKHTHSHIPLLILATTITLLVLALYMYMFGATQNAATQAGLARDIVATEQNDQTQAKNLAQIASSTTGDRSELSSLFISSDNVVSLITMMEYFGSQSGSKVTITSIDADPLTNPAPGSLSHAHIHIDDQGSWISVMTMLSLTERMPYAGSISHVKMNINSSDPKLRTWDLSFDVQVPLLVPITATTTTT